MSRGLKRGLFSVPTSTFVITTIFLTIFAFKIEGRNFFKTPNDTLKVWIYLKEGIQEKYLKPIEYPERTLKRLNKVGWMKREYPSDYYPSEEIIAIIKNHVLEIRHYSRILKAFSALISKKNYLELEKIEFVEKIEQVRTFVKKRHIDTFDLSKNDLEKAGNEQNFYGESYKQLELINIPAVQNLGLTGKGVRITLIDAGFRKDHSAFKKILDENRLVAEHDFLFGDNNVQNENEEDIIYHQSSHGTSVWSLIGGFVPDTIIGAAYGAEFLLAKTERIQSETRVEEDDYVAAIEWSDSLGTDIISTSLAYRDFNDGFCYDFSVLDGESAVTTKAVNWAFERGILFVTAAGNDGSNPKFPDGGLYTPADAYGALTIGAVNEDGIIASFSSHGPTFDGRIKPDLCAMGVSDYVARDFSIDGYGHGSGTSFSTPLIAGAAALILERYPNWSPSDVINELKNFSSKSNEPDSLYGWGIPDVQRVILENEKKNYPNISIKRDKIAIYPNPSNEIVTFFFKWSVKPKILHEPVELKIFDLSGRFIWKKFIPAGLGGAKELIDWDLTDNTGRRVASGVYLIYLKTKSDKKIGKMVVIN